MKMHPDVLVIGGGVIGLTTAYYLGREGVSVRVLDRSAAGSEASWAGAGIIPPGNPAHAAFAYNRLRAMSAEAFPALTAELLEQTGIDNGYRVCGGIEVFENDPTPVLRIWREERIDSRRLTTEELRFLEPEVRPPTEEIHYLPRMAQVRNPWHVRALVAACEKVNVEIEPNAAVTRLRLAGNRVAAAIIEDGREHVADRFLVAAGAWSDRLLLQLGVRTGVHPVRGQIVLFRSPEPLLRRVVSVGKCYLVPRQDGRILAGATEEPEAGFEKRTTEIGVGGLVRFATGLLPRLATAEVEKTWAGLRPGSPDGLPFLGPVPGTDNVFAATGHFRAGIQLSPGTASVMSELLAGRRPAIPLDDFRLDRPPAPPFPTAFRS
jgi:glycine oxidase